MSVAIANRPAPIHHVPTALTGVVTCRSVQDHIAIFHTGRQVWNSRQEATSLRRQMKMLPGREVLDPVDAKVTDDVVRCVALVLVKIQNADTFDLTVSVERHGSDHQAVEGTKPVGV